MNGRTVAEAGGAVAFNDRDFPTHESNETENK